VAIERLVRAGARTDVDDDACIAERRVDALAQSRVLAPRARVAVADRVVARFQARDDTRDRAARTRTDRAACYDSYPSSASRALIRNARYCALSMRRSASA
jgi:hypothetical protein